MHGACSLHYPVTPFTGHIFIIYMRAHTFVSELYTFEIFLILIFWIFITYLVKRFYSASLMNPGNLEKNFMNTKA